MKISPIAHKLCQSELKICYKPAKVVEFRQIWSHWMCRNHNTPSVISSSLNAKMIFDFLKQILSHDFAWSDK